MNFIYDSLYLYSYSTWNNFFAVHNTHAVNLKSSLPVYVTGCYFILKKDTNFPAYCVSVHEMGCLRKARF